jgi:hypothetical protein
MRTRRLVTHRGYVPLLVLVEPAAVMLRHMVMRDVRWSALVLVACLTASACATAGSDRLADEVTPDIARSEWEPGEPGREALVEGRLGYEAPPGKGLTISGYAVAVPRLYKASQAEDGRLVLSSPDRPDLVEGDCVTGQGGNSGDRFAVDGYLRPSRRPC